MRNTTNWIVRDLDSNSFTIAWLGDRPTIVDMYLEKPDMYFIEINWTEKRAVISYR